MASKSDKIHQRRKSTANLQRPKASTQPNTRILLVCEGEATEVNYFEHFKTKNKLSNVQLTICGKECGSAPSSVFDFAIKTATSEGSKSYGGYDHIFCIFDRDAHDTFESTKDKILLADKKRAKHGGGSIKAIWSIPSIEIWFLMHFSYTRTPFVAYGNLSAAEAVTKELKKNNIFSNYKKGLDQTQLRILDGLEADARKNSISALKDVENTGEANPSTMIHLLLDEIKKTI